MESGKISLPRGHVPRFECQRYRDWLSRLRIWQLRFWLWCVCGGGGNASADYAVAVGAGAQAIGYSSVAFGIWTIAIQPASFASGYAAFATGYSSVATGYVTQAVGNYSTASNQQTLAYGQAATAMGISTRADTLGSVAIGRFNVGVADSGGWTAWRPTDPIFEVGNGASATQRANAFTVYKNGTAEVAGYPIVTASTFPTYLGNGSVANIALSSGPNRSISVNASSTGAGNDLKIQAGNSANGTDLAGGSLVLSAGSSTGSAGSAIEFRTAMGGSLGGGIAAPATRLKINALGGIEAGQGLTAAAAPQLVIGKYNNSANDGTGNHGQGLFVVGAGTGVGTNAKNAMRVLEDGTIVIQPAGDIDMGIFNEGERP